MAPVLNFGRIKRIAMFIYNITVKVDWDIHDDWLNWMRKTDIPRMVDSPYFSAQRMVRLLEVDDTEGPTYAVQYTTDALEKYQAYITEQSAVDNANGYSLWGDRCVLFSTLMEVVN